MRFLAATETILVYYSMDWNNSTPYIYYFLLFSPTVRSLFQTVRLLNLGPDGQNASMRQRKSPNMASKL